ncbi:hypothetical protein Slala05_81210 [Streptomyces lavendulae subsp. lavendulae]|nr:hypothetical protein Slala05_81210 [Streptomyces lavendulae subsp. lavendulae]
MPDAGPGPGRWVKPTEPTGPTSGPPSRPTPSHRRAVGLVFAVLARPASFALPVIRYAFLRGLVAGRPAVAEPRAGRVGGRAARDPLSAPP